DSIFPDNRPQSQIPSFSQNKIRTLNPIIPIYVNIKILKITLMIGCLIIFTSEKIPSEAFFRASDGIFCLTFQL
ncbi:TPA: hypothetical protein ACKJ6E_001570, partial [Neisseria gonorrhoeae]